MPVVNGKHYPYTKEGFKKAKKAKRKESYSKGAVKRAMEMAK